MGKEFTDGAGLPSPGRWKVRDRNLPNNEVAEALRATTRDEVERGECRGPFTRAQMDKLFPGGWLPCVRFAVCQKGKVRPCDDYAKYGHNYGRKLWPQNCLSVSCPFHVEHWVLFKMQK